MFFYCKYLKTKKLVLLYKKPQIFGKLLTVLILLMLPFLEAAVRRCSIKQMFSSILQKHKKHLCRSFVLTKLQASRKRLPYRCFPVNFVKILRTSILQNIPELLLLRFEEVINKTDVKKFCITKRSFQIQQRYIFIKSDCKGTTTCRELKSHRRKQIYEI